MAETPKAENETGAPVTAGEGADTLSDAATATAQDRAAGAGEDALSDGPNGSPTDGPSYGSDSVSGVAASGAVDGGAGQDSLSGTSAGTTASPWAASSGTIVGADDSSASGSSTVETPEPAPARAASSGGGATRFVVFVILIVLIGGVGYATYPEWRDEAVPYAEMIGVTLPEVPADPDAPTDTVPTDTASTDTAPADTASTDTAAPAPDSTPQTGTASADSSQTASAPATSAPAAEAPANTVSLEDFEALSERVATLEAEIARQSDAPAAAVSTSGGEELSERIASLESRFTALSDEMAIVRQGLGVAEDTDGVSSVASDLSDRLAQLDSRLSTLEQQEAGPPPVSAEDLAALTRRIDGLQQTSEGGDADLVARLDALAATQKDLAAKVAQGRNRQEQAGAFLLAANLLAAASSDSGTFSAELDAVETAALDQPEVGEAIGTLRTHAGGVPSEADLRSRFPSVAASIIDASIVGAGDDVVGTALTRIASLVTLRRTETEEGDDIDAIVNRAEAAANAGDLPGAVQALGALDGDPAKVAQPWIAEAQARIAVDRAVRTLQSRALATLSGG
ncbi:mitofilin family membrane protein [Thalassobaculum sp.]|uniref:mitofilin family membrane protein n=1 Tax=Thalassobaculum sp. TaxID=2022740 RepID=UPI003B5B88D8